MKQKYEVPELYITRFETVDVILASEEDNYEDYPWGEETTAQ